MTAGAAYQKNSARLLIATAYAGEITHELQSFVQLAYDQVVTDKEDQVILLL